jgi:hypothetical protein
LVVSIPVGRRRDTVELVTELRRERRNAMLLGTAGVAIIALLFLLYFTMVDSGDVPVAPVGGPTTAESAPVPAPVGEPSPPAVAAPAAPARVTVILPAKAPLWIDGESIGKVKEHVAELAPGKHELKAKVGKKMLTQSIETAAGETTEVRLDAKAKKAAKKGR